MLAEIERFVNWLRRCTLSLSKESAKFLASCSIIGYNQVVTDLRPTTMLGVRD